MSKQISTEPFPPGEFIQDALDSRGWTQDDLADVMGRSRQHVNRLLGGHTAITPDTAIELAAAFDTSAEFWMNLQTSYELSLASKEDRDIERRAYLYKRFPVRDMQKRHWIPKVKSTNDLERSLCEFFGVSDIEVTPNVSVAARKGTEYGTDSLAHVAWYCKVRSLSRQVTARPYKEKHLEELIGQLRELAAYPDDARRVPRVLADGGIKLVVVQHLSKTRIDGVATWVDNEPVIGLSLRYDRIDNFWFNLLHEIIHIKYRDDSPVDIDVINAESETLPLEEQRANREAAEILIPTRRLDSLVSRHGDMFSHKAVIQFAHARGVHPGIVVGQLQHRKALPPTHLNKLKAKYREYILGQTRTDGWGHEPTGD